MNETFYERCKKVVAELDLSYEQGIARDVILNELDLLEKQVADYQKRFSEAIEYIEHLEWIEMSFDILGKERIKGTTKDFVNDLLDILKGSDKE